MSYRLFYWRLRGRGEQIRLLLNALNQPYEEVFVSQGDDFLRMKESGPSLLYFGSVPMLEDGDFRLSQGPAIMNYLGRKHGIMPRASQAAARTEALVLGAEDLRMAYFRILGSGDRAEARRRRFLERDWPGRWLPAWDGLLGLNGDTGYLVSSSLTPADVAAWDALDAIVSWIDGAEFGAFSRVARFYERIRAQPGIAAYLGSNRRLQATEH